MSARLQELLRQKALLSEHSAWLDREIAIEQARAAPADAGSGSPPAPEASLAVAAAAPAQPEQTAGPPSAQPEVSPASPAPVAGKGSTPPVPAEYQTEPKLIRRAVTWGCLLYFMGALALLGLGLAAIFIFYRHR